MDGSKHVTFSGARINCETRREMSSNFIVHNSVSGLGEASPVRGVFTAGSVSSSHAVVYTESIVILLIKRCQHGDLRGTSMATSQCGYAPARRAESRAARDGKGWPLRPYAHGR